MYELDLAVTQAINDWTGASAILDFIMIWASNIGVQLLVVAVIALWWRRTERRYTRHVAVSAGLSFLFGLAINQFILLFVHRMRPYDAGVTHLLLAPSSDFSFPSDHTTATFAIAATFLLHRTRRLGLVFLAAAMLVMLSRVYDGVHYASDVLGGALTGAIAATVVRAFYREGTRIDRLITSIL